MRFRGPQGWGRYPKVTFPGAFPITCSLRSPVCTSLPMCSIVPLDIPLAFYRSQPLSCFLVSSPFVLIMLPCCSHVPLGLRCSLSGSLRSLQYLRSHVILLVFIVFKFRSQMFSIAVHVPRGFPKLIKCSQPFPTTCTSPMGVLKLTNGSKMLEIPSSSSKLTSLACSSSGT